MAVTEIALTPEEQAFADKAVGLFNGQWQALHKRLETEIWPKMGVPEATTQTFINLAIPIFREAIAEWEKTTAETTAILDGKVAFLRKSLMRERIMDTWGVQKGTIGRQVKRYL
jgi:hypothetical protein